MTTPGKDAVGARAPESVSFPAAAPAPAPGEADEEAAPMPPAPMADPNAAIGRQRDVVRASFAR